MATILDLSGAALQRQIVASKTFQNYLTIEENHTDDSIITEHPIEAGAVMSDHIYHRPPQVGLRLGWSNADLAGGGDPGYVRGVYADLQKLKTDRKLFKVYTGKRLYNNMFINSLRVRTDEHYEFALVAECEMKQVLLVSTQTVSGAPTTTTAGPSLVTGGASDRVVGSQVVPGGSLTPTINSGSVQGTTQNFDLGGTAPTGLSDSLAIPPVPETSIGTPNSDGGGAGPLGTEGGF